MHMNIEMPIPSQEQLQRSLRCKQLLVEEIESMHGSISFEQYMQICLYSKNIGYYESCEEIFGKHGDFTTSPERSSYYAAAYACYIQRLTTTLSELSIIEVGAGSGKFARDLLNYLKQLDCLPKQYIIIEKSTALTAWQKNNLDEYRDTCDIVWLQTPEEEIENGIVIANEVLDALPVRLLTIRNNHIKERRVSLDNQDKLVFVEQDIEEDLEELIRRRMNQDVMQQNSLGYCTEINLYLNDFVEQIASFVKQGIFFYVDYGYPRDEYYHIQRHMGTIMCHFKHAANDQLLLWPGLQDISCNVDFTALAEAADRINLQVNCYSTQAHFLLASHVLELVKFNDCVSSVDQQAELKRLLMPGEMGERFQVMVLGKNVDLSMYQFTTRDLRHRL